MNKVVYTGKETLQELLEKMEKRMETKNYEIRNLRKEVKYLKTRTTAFDELIGLGEVKHQDEPEYEIEGCDMCGIERDRTRPNYALCGHLTRPNYALYGHRTRN